VNFKKIEDPLDWEVGTHGIEVDWGRGKSSTFLPEVAEEQGWSKEETM